MNIIHLLAEMCQRSMSNLCNSNDKILNTTVKECTPTQCIKRDENTEGGMKEYEGWTKPTKCEPIISFYKKHDKINENDNNSNNRYDVLKI